MWASQKIFAVLAPLLLVSGLAACAAEPVGTESALPQKSEDAGVTKSEVPAEQPDEPATVLQEATCDWGSSRLQGTGETSTEAPSNIEAQIIGAWQHTYFDTGSGREAPGPDIRYIFPTVGGMVYCQDLPGVTDQAENHAEITFEGNLIQPSGGHPGFQVVAMSQDTMRWINNLDGSQYILERR